MKQSTLFTKARREGPKDEVAKNAELLIRGGYIRKEMAGVYALLPLGLRVVEKIKGIVREEMNAIGGQEVSLTALQSPEAWEKTGRWSDDVIDVWFKTALKSGTVLGLAATHEEPLTAIMKDEIRSYKDLPVSVYQFQNKFRNELRAKSGILRGREFLMKDFYSFHATQEDLDAFYEEAAKAYERVFARLGLGSFTYKTFASGGAFSKWSHEYQTVCDAGEDLIYIDEAKNIALNKEVHMPEVLAELGLDEKNLVEKKAIEVGNIFKLGTRFSEPLGLMYQDADGTMKPVIMGCYGIGITRLMGTLVEAFADEKGIVWPKSAAPFAVHLVYIPDEDGKTKAEADRAYDMLAAKGIEVLYDDREIRAGEKFAESDLLGIPTRAVVSARSLEAGGAEICDRATGEKKIVPLDQINETL